MNADVGDESITTMLLQYGASITVKDYRGHYPLHCAAFSGNVKIVDILLKADESKVTLNHRISYGKKSIIKGASLYHVAVLKENVDLIDILLQNKLCPNIRDFYGRTPLYLAIYGCKSREKKKRRRIRWWIEEVETGKQFKVVKKLLDHTDVRIAEKDGYTPLHAAVHKGHLEIVKLLGPLADVNAQDKYGKTPLHTACDEMNLDIFKILVEDFKADYRMRTKSNKTIFDILASKTELRCIRRRYKNRKSVTNYMFEYPRFKSFRDIISVKDPDFVKQVISNIGIEEEYECVDQSEQGEANEDIDHGK
ncbi:serine/threonine-protein phosphatase 6 regulatory ankyrin repeat subunit A-like [Mercenaria mercenaria]|uniref:serine/threonine-protein phosphatase 6 regulatory ankyrin repeat subunit A-like n=1 Tax=Mercenaria mercenaria TaxID=6596 RepID=UPI00234EDECF|nr:serine/threonine-protein phosphatase 6 regulatory ankyrin repeat subunit A-like [Mercenaria mercenaria]